VQNQPLTVGRLVTEAAAICTSTPFCGMDTQGADDHPFQPMDAQSALKHVLAVLLNKETASDLLSSMLEMFRDQLDFEGSFRQIFDLAEGEDQTDYLMLFKEWVMLHEHLLCPMIIENIPDYEGLLVDRLRHQREIEEYGLDYRPVG
jgi:hypothetical protein